MNCALSEVKHKCLVLPLDLGYDPRSILAALPEEVFLKTMRYLETLDLFHMTLVCKRWKSLVYNNRTEMKRVEHSLSLHLITFTDWMVPASTFECFSNSLKIPS